MSHRLEPMREFLATQHRIDPTLVRPVSEQVAHMRRINDVLRREVTRLQDEVRELKAQMMGLHLEYRPERKRRRYLARKAWHYRTLARSREAAK